LTLTTNGSKLTELSTNLHNTGVKRLNIRLDTLDSEQFTELTRFGKLDKVLDGIQAAKRAGFERIKLNAVILKNRNLLQVPALLDYALTEGLDITFIEEMPLGTVVEHSRKEEFCSSAEIRAMINREHPLQASEVKTGGPSRYWTTPGYESRIGFISPHSENFCASCNRVRVTAEGRLLFCLGNENSVELRDCSP